MLRINPDTILFTRPSRWTQNMSAERPTKPASTSRNRIGEILVNCHIFHDDWRSKTNAVNQYTHSKNVRQKQWMKHEYPTVSMAWSFHETVWSTRKISANGLVEEGTSPQFYFLCFWRQNRLFADHDLRRQPKIGEPLAAETNSAYTAGLPEMSGKPSLRTMG